MDRRQWLLWGGLDDGRRTLRDWVVDALIFLAAVGSGIYVLADTWDAHSGPVAALDIALGSIACLSLWWRRERPLVVALVCVLLSSVSALAGMATLPAVFNAAIRLPWRQLLGVVALAVAANAILPALYPQVEGKGYGWQFSVGLLLTAVAVGWGLFVRAQRELLGGLRERAEAEAREAERRRIAREMHDVLAHRLSLLSVHAGALENAGDRLPVEYREAAGVIRGNARLALEELRTVIGVLREEVSGPPQPTLAEIPALVEESRAAGLEVSLQLEGDVPDTVGRTAYRAVQEGLTNARKHGGSRVDLRIGGRPLIVELVSYGSARTSLPGSGTGLVGLSERVQLAGGSVTYGPVDGNFVLRAEVPW